MNAAISYERQKEKEEFSAALRNFREGCGWTLQYLRQEVMRVSGQHIYLEQVRKWTIGDTLPSGPFLAALYEIFPPLPKIRPSRKTKPPGRPGGNPNRWGGQRGPRNRLPEYVTTPAPEFDLPSSPEPDIEPDWQKTDGIPYGEGIPFKESKQAKPAAVADPTIVAYLLSQLEEQGEPSIPLAQLRRLIELPIEELSMKLKELGVA
jgi:hypothetical protein